MTVSQLMAGGSAGDLAKARETYAGIDTKAARIAFLRALFAQMRDRRLERGVAFSLRELRKLDTLSFGEARRLFLALERTERSAVVDRYVRALHHLLPTAGLPLRKALNLLWATGRPAALLDYLRAQAPDRLTDRETIALYAAQFVKFNDLMRSGPLFAHLVTLDPGDTESRLGLARALIAGGDHAGAADHCRAAREFGGNTEDIDRVAQNILDSLNRAAGDGPSPAAIEPVRLAPSHLQTPAWDGVHRTPIDRSLGPSRTPAAPVPDAAKSQRRELDSVEEAIELLAPLHPATRAHHLVSHAAVPLILALDPEADRATLERLLRASPGLAGALADRSMAADDAQAGLAVFHALAENHAAPVWTHAIRLAVFADSPEDLAEFAGRLAATPDALVDDLRDTAQLFVATRPTQADRFWMRAVVANRNDRIVPTALRALYAVEASTAFYRIATGIAGGTLRPTIETPAYIETMRILLARGWRWSDAASLTDAAANTIDPALPDDVALWTRAIFAWAGFDYAQARALFDEGFDSWPDSIVSFASERAILAARFGKYGIVASDLTDFDRAIPSDGHHAPLRHAAAIVAAASPAPDAFYPHYLIDAIFDRALPKGYDPIPSSLVTIVSALSSGGSERQAVSAIEALSHDPRVATQSLLIRSVTPTRRAFFLPQVEASGVPFHVFNGDTADEARVLALLDEPPGSALSIALPLLPANLRLPICQLVPLLLERRPAVVHIRQDFVAAALACVLAGVPRFFIHRGSLTPDYWDHSVPQHLATVAPMRHVYRRLVTWPGFGFINNALSGVRSDREWTGSDDPTRFALVHNIVDFAGLGSMRDADDTVRRSIGAAPGDLVVGAAFRFHRVKRPLLWLAAARRILASHPKARFLMLGDGEMKDAMIAYAEAEGFADRLHLPGSVSDIAPWYRAMDIALLTSEREGLPNMLIEAQHFGVVPVSTDVGGAAETMEVGITGILVAPESTAEAIGDAVVAAFDDRAWHARASAAAPGFVHDHFGAVTAIEQLIALYGFADADRSAL